VRCGNGHWPLTSMGKELTSWTWILRSRCCPSRTWTGRGAEVSEVFHDAGGVFRHAGTKDRVAGPAPGHDTYGSFASFSDPDGNG